MAGIAIRTAALALVAGIGGGIVAAGAQARGALGAGARPARGRALRRASAIIDEGLRGALDLERGGELAGNLQELYTYIVMRLTQAHANSDPALLDECQRLIQPLREAWSAIKPQRLAA